jgi:hypothetical protein
VAARQDIPSSSSGNTQCLPSKFKSKRRSLSHVLIITLYIITGEACAGINACRYHDDNEHYNKSITLTRYHVLGTGCIFILAYALPFFFLPL